MKTINTPTTAPDPKETTDLLELLGTLNRRKWHLIIGIGLGVVLSAVYYLATPPTFRATMDILVGQKSGDVARGASRSASVEGVQAEEDILSTHIQLFNSRRILQAALDNHELTKIPSIQKAMEEGDSPIEYLRDNLKVVKGGNGVARDAHTLKAEYDDPSPTNCAVVLRAIYDEYEKYLKEHFEGTSSKAVDLVAKVVEKNAAAAAEAEKQLVEFMSSTEVTWNGELSGNRHKDRLEQIEALLIDLTQTQAETESRLAVITKFLDENDPAEITDVDRLSLLSEKEVNRLQLVYQVTRGDVTSEAFQAEQPIRQESARAEYTEYLSLVMREKKLREVFGDDHPSVVSVQEQIGLMREFIDENAASEEAMASIERMRPAEMLQTYVGLLRHDLDEMLMRRDVSIGEEP